MLRIQIHRIRKFLGLLDLDPASDPSIIKQKNEEKKTLIRTVLRLLYDFFSLEMMRTYGTS